MSRTPSHPQRLILASRSPRRFELLVAIGLAPEVIPSSIPESAVPGEPADSRVRRLACAKGREVAARTELDSAALVLSADTEVVIDGESLGKPRDSDEATSMLRRLGGRAHEVLTATYLTRTDDAREVVHVERTTVRFRRLDDRIIRRYVASGEPMDKAGAYGIQGRGALLVEEVRGSWWNVVGLPVERLHGWLAELGVDLWLLATR